MIYFWETQERRLYDISNDIGEQNNIADNNPAIVEELSQELTDYLIGCKAQRPTLNGENIPWPIDAVYNGKLQKKIRIAVNEKDNPVSLVRTYGVVLYCGIIYQPPYF